jgi:hypothetical protein
MIGSWQRFRNYQKIYSEPIRHNQRSLARLKDPNQVLYHCVLKLVISKRDEIEAYSLIDELRGQVKELNKQNSSLKNKV